jgi:hypothetical protein
MKIKEIWNKIPDNIDGVKKYYDETLSCNVIEILSQKFTDTCDVLYVIECLKKADIKYGDRARKALGGPDLKSITHAVRACLQLRELYQDHTITFPLKDREMLMKIKTGQLDFETVVSPMLDTLIKEVEELCANSTFPERVNREFWNDFILATVKNNM